ELQHAALVEDHRIEIRRIEPRVIQAPLDRADRKPGVVLPPRQPLFLNRADRHAVDDERGGGIVIAGGDAENVHGISTGWTANRCRARSAPTRAARAVRHAWPATRRAAARRST